MDHSTICILSFHGYSRCSSVHPSNQAFKHATNSPFVQPLEGGSLPVNSSTDPLKRGCVETVRGASFCKTDGRGDTTSGMFPSFRQVSTFAVLLISGAWQLISGDMDHLFDYRSGKISNTSSTMPGRMDCSSQSRGASQTSNPRPTRS